MTPSVFALFCTLAALLPCLVHGHMIEVAASKKECFFEDLHINDQMTVTYQVGGGGHLDIDFWLADPDNHALGKHIKQSTGSVSITAKKDGRHEYCFSNQMSAVADKLVSFNVHGVIYVGEDDTIAPVEREIRDLANGLKSVKDEQEYIVVRERRHRNTAESTNSRVKWWSILQAILVFSVVAWQVYYLKSFFEVKRVI
ncbi:supernatant protein factor SPF C-terminal domain-containing protein [Gloeophyllum trabeum ATCC 11539]|uniref:Supernatant protein factor SPF C-terminal domain-containing protein n=1 Tax=Gloeophyllum trabeum (strain ATCC 11539 / FP-39264 / Madison 617) TaxID=670483 RepID=S7RWV4_GLOTA|nr:supernatant protein factor SPF C-terminal domain-containing protein [Gloeophyllum trabeum ATCC 11539]EPQ59380.1 supernatant protein factor SPF C-terminal domain-containing protein [Gloeophyllum trabeum ATCC 11539]